ncbi:MAG: hypothetical protein ABH914_03380, partial [Candidatus Omnitrophota bacterium]
RLRAIQFYNGILRGDSVSNFPFPKPYAVPLNNLLAFLFLAGLFFLLLLPQKSNKFSKKRIIFFLIVYSSIFLCTPLTLSVLAINHLLVLFPFPQLIVSLALVCLLSLRLRKGILKRAVSASVYLMLALVLTLNMNLIARYYWKGAKEGKGTSVAIYELADYLANENLKGPVIALQGRLHHNIPFLTHGKVFVFSREGISNNRFKKLMEFYLKSKGQFYVIGSEDDMDIPGRMKYQEFMELTDRHKRECRIIKIFCDKFSGLPRYYLLKVFPQKTP